MKYIEIISRGVCICKKQPDSIYGLEGYNIGSKYMFERCIECSMINYIRIYPIEMNPDETEPLNFTPPFAYDTKSPIYFKRFFDLISEQNI